MYRVTTRAKSIAPRRRCRGPVALWGAFALGLVLLPAPTAQAKPTAPEAAEPSAAPMPPASAKRRPPDPCKSDKDCSKGQSCKGGFCESPPGPPPDPRYPPPVT
jgi:hypothetical protein